MPRQDTDTRPGSTTGIARRLDPAGTGARTLLSYLRRVYSEPFSGDPKEAELPLPTRERRRRAALFRLIVLTLTVLQAIAMPSTIANHPPPAVVATQLFVLLLGIVCLALNAAGWTTAAGAIDVFGAFGLADYTIFHNSGGLDARALLIYSLVAIFIILSGLLLPRWAIWLGLVAALAALMAGLVLLPVAPGLLSDMSSLEGSRGLAGGLLAVLYALTAVLTWVLARSAQAGLAASTRAFEQERELAALKDQFIVDANHELRTPIMALYGNVELLLELGERAAPEQRRRVLERTQRSGDIVLHLLNSVLEAGAIGAGAPALRIQPTPLAPLVLSVLEGFDPREIGEPGLQPQRASQRPVHVHVPASLAVLADETRLRQVLINLLSNALKYSPLGAR